jgi:hypothetical protein
MDEALLNQFSSPLSQGEDEFDLDSFSSPVLEDTGQGFGTSMGSEAVRSLAKVGTGTVEGLGQFGSSFVRNLNPVGWAAKLGVPGAQGLVDMYSGAAESIAGGAADVQTSIEDALPVNPLFQDTLPVQAAGVGGQVAGQLATILTGAAVTKAPKILQALGLGQAGLLGLESGYANADEYGITGWQRDALAASYAAAEAGVEGIGGFGSPSFTKALLGEVREALGKGAGTRVLKTIGSEAVEEPITGTLQGSATHAFAEEDPNRPGFTVNGAKLPNMDPTSSEFWSDRGQEALLGGIGGSLFGVAAFTGSRPTRQQKENTLRKIDLTLAVLGDKPDQTPEEQQELAQLAEEGELLRADLQTEVVQDETAITSADTLVSAAQTAQEAGMPETAAMLEAIVPPQTEISETEIQPIETPTDAIAEIPEQIRIQEERESGDQIRQESITSGGDSLLSETTSLPQEVVPLESAAPAQQPTESAVQPQPAQAPQNPAVAKARAVVDSKRATLPSAAEAWVGTREELLADPAIRQAFIQNERSIDPDLTEQQASDNFDLSMGNPLMDGVTFGGRTYIIADGVSPTAEDGSFEGAIERILRHEDTHISIDSVTQSNPKRKKEWEGLKKRVSPEKLDNLAKRRYPMFTDWRKNGDSFDNLVHEYFAEQMERDAAGETVDDRPLLEQFIAYMKKVLARVTGREVSLEEIREFVRAGREARTKGLQTGSARASSQGLSQEALDRDAAYMAAVERGDMETAQKMVDEAAKAAGFTTGPLKHGTKKEFTEFKDPSKSKPSEMFSFGFHFTDSDELSAKYGERQVGAFLSLKNPLNAEQVISKDSELGKWLSKIAPRTTWFPNQGKQEVYLKNALDTLPAKKVKQALQEAGYDGLIYHAKFQERQAYGMKDLASGDTFIALYPSQIKSADPVTRDDQGNPELAGSKASNLLRLSRDSVVNKGVIPSVRDSKILDPIIESIPVNVVNMLGSKERATEVLLHDPAVFQNALSSNANLLVGLPAWTRFRDETMGVVTGARAELRRMAASEPASLNREMFAALDALQNNLVTLLGNLSSQGIGSTSDITSTDLSKGTTAFGSEVALRPTKAGSPLQNKTSDFEKVGSTDFTNAFRFHEEQNRSGSGTLQGIKLIPLSQRFNTRKSDIRFSLKEGVPLMPKGSAGLITHKSPYPGMTSEKIVDYAWPRFYAAWKSNLENPDAPLTPDQQAQLEAEWKANLADENAMEIAADNAYSEERMSKADFGLYSPEPSQTTPETGARPAKKKSKTPETTAEDIARRFPRFSLKPQDPVERLNEINQAFSYQTQAGQQEGLDPTKATTDKRTFAADGTPVDFSRAGMTNAGQQMMAKESIDLLSQLSLDGKSKTFGNDLMAYLSESTGSIYGQRLNDLQQTAILNYLDFAIQDRAQMGIDGSEIQRVRSQKLSRAGALLQTAASSIYEPLRDIAEKAKTLTDTKLKEEGVDPVKLDAEIKAAVTASQTEVAKDISTPEVKASILDGAQNDVDDLWEMGLEGMDPKVVSKVRQLDEWVVRLGELRKLEKMLSSAPKGAKASLAAIPDNLTLEQVRALIAEGEAEVKKLTEEIGTAKKKDRRKAKESQDKEKQDNATFSAWVNGSESKGVDSFDDLMLKYIDPNRFNREAFTTVLTNSFKQADPNFISGVVNRVADLLDGAATEEGVAADAAKAPNYNAKAKRLVGTEIDQSATPEVMQVKKDPFTDLTKQRLKGEISVENFQKELVKLGLDEETAFAYLQKVDQDRARIGDAQAQRELNAQAKKDMAAFKRGMEKSDREAQAQIELLAKQFSDTPNLKKDQAISELKKVSNSFLGKEGPPISSEEFLSRLEKLNVTPQKAQNLLKLLQESRRRDAAVRYAKAVQKAAESKQKAIDSAVKKLVKSKTGNQTKLRQQSTFVKGILGALEGGILESESIRQAFAEAYELHGLTPEVLKDLGARLQQINAMKEGMVKETLLNEFNVALNAVAPTASFVGHAHSALMGYILSGMNTMLMQLTGVNRFINPLSNTVEILWSAPGTTAEKLGRTMNPSNFFKLYTQGMREVAENLPQIQAGMSGMISSAGKGVGAMPSGLAAVKPQANSMAWTPWGQLNQARFNTPKILDQIGLGKFIQATRYPAWMVSRSFQAIRAAEGIVGGADKNMQWRSQMTSALMQQDASLTWAQAYDKVSAALGDKTAEMWKTAYKQADEEIKAGTVAKLSRNQRATELVQDQIEAQWELDLKNRPREIAALYGYKQDPLTPAGAWVYGGLSRFLNQDKGVMQYSKFSFLFARFFANAIETAYTRTPLAGLAALALPTEKAEGTLNEREQRIEQIYGSLGAYRDARMARAVSGTAFMGAIAGLMTLALKGWDPEDEDEAPFFWISGDPIGEFSKKGAMEAGGWWKANTLYIGPLRLNYVNASPEMATVMGAMGAMGDRFLYDKLLNYRENKETGEYERSNYEAYGKPVLEALAAPISRSTYRQWYDALESAYAGDFKKMTRIVANPVVGTAVALSPVALVPSVKTLEKLDRSTEQPKSAQSAGQAVMASVPFASEIGLDAGKPLTTPFGNPLTPYPFWSIFSNTQEVPPEVGKAARVLTDLGVARMGPREEYFGWGVAEIAHSGKKFLLNDSERAQVLAKIGTKFARLINQNTAKLKKIEAGAGGREKVRDAVTEYAKQARSEALFAYRRRGK